MRQFLTKNEYKEKCDNMRKTCEEIRILINNGNIYLARKLIVDNLKIFPNDYGLNKLLARILVLEKEYEKALEIYETKLVEESNFQKLMALNLKLGNEEKIYELYNKYYKTGIPYNNEKVNENFKKQVGYEHYKLMRHYLMEKYEKHYKPIVEKLEYNKRQISSYSEQTLI